MYLNGWDRGTKWCNEHHLLHCESELFIYKFQAMCMCILHHLPQEWTKLEGPERAPWPMERACLAACCLNYGEEHPQLLVTGGRDSNDNTQCDAWILDVMSWKWRKVSGYVHMTAWLLQLLESTGICYYISGSAISFMLHERLILTWGQHKMVLDFCSCNNMLVAHAL